MPTFLLDMPCAGLVERLFQVRRFFRTCVVATGRCPGRTLLALCRLSLLAERPKSRRLA